ncbi:hypothetical protein [Shimia sp.]|uniref:hypothetical protein n=1 Tax=Shimia sp. TaxID=1954381 RepID=UPI003298D2A8
MDHSGTAGRLVRQAGAMLKLWVGVALLWGTAAAMQWIGTREKPVPALESPSDTVILFTMDGIRMLELMDGPDPELTDQVGGGTLMPFLMQEVVPKGGFLGVPKLGSQFGLGNPMGLSMPGYQSIFSGRVTACFTNECLPLKFGNLIHSVSDTFGAETVGFYSSYGQLCDTVALPDGCTSVCMRWSDENAAWKGKPHGTRDGMVFDAAMARFREDPPKLLYIGLEETDLVGHLDKYESYMRLLREYDAYLRTLVDEVDRLNAQGHRTTLIVTTDHARGNGDEWGEHSWDVAGTEHLWLMAYGHGVTAQGMLSGGPKRSSLNIRPTIQHLLGLKPGWQPVLSELLENKAR